MAGGGAAVGRERAASAAPPSSCGEVREREAAGVARGWGRLRLRLFGCAEGGSGGFKARAGVSPAAAKEKRRARGFPECVSV